MKRSSLEGLVRPGGSPEIGSRGVGVDVAQLAERRCHEFGGKPVPNPRRY